MADNEIRWGVAQRFEFLEWRAYWTGRVNRRDLEEKFQISTQQASIDLRNYQKVADGNIVYDTKEKAYIATSDFRPQFLSLSPDRFLLQLHALKTGAIDRAATWFEEIPPVDVAPPIVRGPEAYVLQELIQALAKGVGVRINYRSLTSEGMRTICPHAFAYDGQRWHVRAWCVEKLDFRDYVLGRILSIGPMVECKSNPPDDIEWNTHVTLRLVAHPGLNDSQRETIERDYRMKKGELEIPIRVALAYYFVRRHNLDLRGKEVTPERAQIFLSNYEEYLQVQETTKLRSKDTIAAHAGDPDRSG